MGLIDFSYFLFENSKLVFLLAQLHVLGSTEGEIKYIPFRLTHFMAVAPYIFCNFGSKML